MQASHHLSRGQALCTLFILAFLTATASAFTVSFSGGKILVNDTATTVKKVEVWGINWQNYQVDTTVPFEFTNNYGTGSSTSLIVRTSDSNGIKIEEKTVTLNLSGVVVIKYPTYKVGDKLLGMPGMIVQETWRGTLRNPVRTFTYTIPVTNY